MDRPVSAQPEQSTLLAYRAVRQRTLELAAPLSPEDQMVQSMPDASPTKWHLAHTAWFFETFVLAPRVKGYEPFHPAFAYLFNSYYEAVGERQERPKRGVLSRPSHEEVLAYRRHVDAAMETLLSGPATRDLEELVTLGLHHEQQHQELLLTDIKHALSLNVMRPAYVPADPGPPARSAAVEPLRFHAFEGGLSSLGAGPDGFAFDNERPRHPVFVHPFRLANRLVTAGEFAEFIGAGGYQKPELWLSEGWDVVRANGWTAPLYWEQRDGGWVVFTLRGLQPLDPAAPVTHVSFFEADAYARWRDARLPTEAEWELAAEGATLDGNFVERGHLHPQPAASGPKIQQLLGDVWEWTRSDYAPYPGFRTAPGAVGEYNGKFMCNQYVLRGGSCVSPRSHLRTTYRNFFPAGARWQFTGIRLAQDP